TTIFTCIHVTFVASLNSAPFTDMFEIVPPEPAVVPTPVTMKLPVVVFRRIPVVELDAFALTSETPRLRPVRSMAVPLLAVIVLVPVMFSVGEPFAIRPRQAAAAVIAKISASTQVHEIVVSQITG